MHEKYACGEYEKDIDNWVFLYLHSKADVVSLQ